MPIIYQGIIGGKICGYSNPDGLEFCDDCGSDLRNQGGTDGNVIDVEIAEAESEMKSSTLPPPHYLTQYQHQKHKFRKEPIHQRFPPYQRRTILP
jgi:hypothetical protein